MCRRAARSLLQLAATAAAVPATAVRRGSVSREVGRSIEARGLPRLGCGSVERRRAVDSAVATTVPTHSTAISVSAAVAAAIAATEARELQVVDLAPAQAVGLPHHLAQRQ